MSKKHFQKGYHIRKNLLLLPKDCFLWKSNMMYWIFSLRSGQRNERSSDNMPAKEWAPEQEWLWPASLQSLTTILLISCLSALTFNPKDLFTNATHVIFFYTSFLSKANKITPINSKLNCRTIFLCWWRLILIRQFEWKVNRLMDVIFKWTLIKSL